jgi:hypothetical protein
VLIITLIKILTTTLVEALTKASKSFLKIKILLILTIKSLKINKFLVKVTIFLFLFFFFLAFLTGALILLKSIAKLDLNTSFRNI